MAFFQLISTELFSRPNIYSLTAEITRDCYSPFEFSPCYRRRNSVSLRGSGFNFLISPAADPRSLPARRQELLVTRGKSFFVSS